MGKKYDETIREELSEYKPHLGDATYQLDQGILEDTRPSYDEILQNWTSRQEVAAETETGAYDEIRADSTASRRDLVEQTDTSGFEDILVP